MVFVGTELGSVAVIPRDDSAEALFSLNHTYISRFEVGTKNFVSDIQPGQACSNLREEVAVGS